MENADLKPSLTLTVATGKNSSIDSGSAHNGVINYPPNKEISFRVLNNRAAPNKGVDEELFIGNEEEILKWLINLGIKYVKLYEEEGWILLKGLYNNSNYYWKKIGGIHYRIVKQGSNDKEIVFYTKTTEDFSVVEVYNPITNKRTLDSILNKARDRNYSGFIPDNLFMVSNGNLVNVKSECIRNICLERLLGIW